MKFKDFNRLTTKQKIAYTITNGCKVENSITSFGKMTLFSLYQLEGFMVELSYEDEIILKRIIKIQEA
ncbi:hypothetical protein [Tenacibaculum soleae]|uniref:hypothetical protein n=1 Tax=Tenacibaculum soleae TaxID=447689 RepID=UPI002300A367|nr:hypothetical protein [Tenacibaculum soleae]